MRLVREKSGDPERAVQEWKLGDTGPLWEHLSRLATARGDLVGSIEFFQGAIAVRPDRLDNYFSLVWVFWPGLGRVEDAISTYEKTATIGPGGSAEGPLAEGYVFRLRGDWVQAQRSFEQAATVDPRNADAHRQAALAAVQLHGYPVAIEHLKQAVAATPEDSWIYVELGDACRGAGDYAAASSWYSKAAKVDAANPGAPRGLASVGDHYPEDGAVAQAVDEFRRAIALDAKDSDYHRRVARCFERSDRTGDAVFEYRRVLELDPGDAASQQALARLAPPKKHD